MAHVPLPVPPVPLTALVAALETLRRATEPPLTDPDAPVRLVDLPSVWRGYLHDEADAFLDLVPPGHGEIRRPDWARVLARLGRQIEIPYRMAEILALVEKGPTPEDLDRAPRLAPWAPALALNGVLVVAGHVTGHPRLGETWMRSSLLMGLDSSGGWARTWKRWYRLGEPLTESDLPLFWQSGVPAEPLDKDYAPLVQHFADLRTRASHLLASLVPLVPSNGEDKP